MIKPLPPTPIVIFDKSRLTRDALVHWVTTKPRLHVRGSTFTLQHLLPLVNEKTVVLLHATLDKSETVALIEQIIKRCLEAKVLVLGVVDNPHEIFPYLEAGALGYLLQQESLEKLEAQITAIAHNKPLISSRLAMLLIKRFQQERTFSRSITERFTMLKTLSRREQEVLILVSEGCSNQDIAQKLVIEYGTAKNHVHQILRKLKSPNRREVRNIYEIYGKRVHQVI